MANHITGRMLIRINLFTVSQWSLPAYPTEKIKKDRIIIVIPIEVP
jgi:hypothetical protein